jgi:hypothetical protein
VYGVRDGKHENFSCIIPKFVANVRQGGAILHRRPAST